MSSEARRCHVCKEYFGTISDAEWESEWRRHERSQDHLNNLANGFCRPLSCIHCELCSSIAVGPWNSIEMATLKCKNGHQLSGLSAEMKEFPWWMLMRDYPEKYVNLCRSRPHFICDSSGEPNSSGWFPEPHTPVAPCFLTQSNYRLID